MSGHQRLPLSHAAGGRWHQLPGGPQRLRRRRVALHQRLRRRVREPQKRPKRSADFRAFLADFRAASQPFSWVERPWHLGETLRDQVGGISVCVAAGKLLLLLRQWGIIDLRGSVLCIGSGDPRVYDIMYIL